MRIQERRKEAEEKNDRTQDGTIKNNNTKEKISGKSENR